MIAYFDTSAIIPLLLPEPTTPLCERLWENADSVITSLITYVEASAAIAQAERMKRIDAATHQTAREALDEIFSEVDVLHLSDAVVRRAAELTHTHALRGYDAVQCASAARIWSSEMVAISGDHDLLDAWRDLGVFTIDTNRG